MATPAVACGESIALLSLLHSVPVPPSKNHWDPANTTRGGYTLPFKRERRLVGILGFLSSISDDPDHVTAVCVEENSHGESLDVLLAINRGKPGGLTQVSRKLEEGFGQIFRELFQSVEDRGRTVEERVFSAIIVMCSQRILCRLGLIRKARGTTRQPIKATLQEAIYCLGELPTQPDTTALFVEKAREVMKRSDAWTRHQTTARLGDLVEAIHHLWQVADLRSLMDTISNRLMDPSSRRSMCNVVSKVARYREAARFLSRTAKKYPLVRRMKFVLAKLPPEFFLRASTGPHSPQLEFKVSRLTPGNRQELDLERIYHLLETDADTANRRFCEQTAKTMEESKIHAEIQLFFYCELRNSRRMPRVICASKDACYLCNLFIGMHGKIHVPRSHGKLYPAWRLPQMAKSSFQMRFNRALDEKLRESLSLLVSRAAKMRYPDPNESTLLTLPWSASTLRGVPPVVANLEPDIPVEETPLQQPAVTDSPKDHTPQTSSTPHSEELEVAIGVKSAREEAQPDPKASSHDAESTGQLTISPPSKQEEASTSTRPFQDLQDNELVQGQVLRSNLKVNGVSPLYDAGLIRVRVEYAGTMEGPTATSAELEFGVEWLSEKDAEVAWRGESVSVIDAASLVGEVSLVLPDSNCLYIGAWRCVMKVRVHRVDGG
ncbi:hypothetical protein B0T14DRAFT_251330 [Immersiella caudata]|uniref:Uncharacterized protein n=1 Tax=Immersiella caudata TaxID=314043 RepID=A0AA40BX26_9PEZI|nr:hypothetical protein B0T14DRAFT_251330 [Immersiella caudata]